jgi:hypothetical protein
MLLTGDESPFSSREGDGLSRLMILCDTRALALFSIHVRSSYTIPGQGSTYRSAHRNSMKRRKAESQRSRMANRNNPIHAPTIGPGLVGIQPWKRMVSPGVMWRDIPDEGEDEVGGTVAINI